MSLAGVNRSLSTKGYQQITTLTSAVNLTVPAGTGEALVRVSGQNVRWRSDGTAPDANTGMPLSAGEERSFQLNELNKLMFIEVAASAALDVTYFG